MEKLFRCDKLHSHRVYLLLNVPNMTTLLCVVFQHSFLEEQSLQEQILMKRSQFKDSQINKQKKDGEQRKCNYHFVFVKKKEH